jgi:peptide/nickel transport system substrate-binding protein
MTLSIPRARRVVSLLAAGALALTAAGCADSERDDTSAEGSEGSSGGTFVFAGSEEPVTLDPFYASDGESFRVARQIFEGLVGTVPGEVEPAPLLATEWETNEDGTSTTFTLRDDVTFSDGEPFNAEAVCANFERWYNQPEGIAQSEDLTYYYLSIFRGFATGKQTDSLYKSCSADSEFEVTVNLTSPFAGFVSSMSLPAFSMQSPAAFEKYAVAPGKDPRQGPYATQYPTGTGPFVLDSWEQGTQVTLKRNEDYWGEPALVDEAVVVAIPDPKGRADALEAGDIDGFDLVGPADVTRLEEAGYTIINRPPYNMLYLGMNQAVKPLDDIQVRTAIAHAIDKEEVVSSSLPEGTVPATQFVPDLVTGYSEDVPTYEYDPELAKEMLADAGQENLTIEFNYPTDISRPYMPSPEETFNVIRSQLEEVGITVKPTADQWEDYLGKIQGTSKHGIHLLGWTGDYNDPDNFLGVFFGRESSEWGFDNPDLFQMLTEGRSLSSVEEQDAFYQDANNEVMEFLPGVPLASPAPSLAFAENVEGYQASPVQDEVWNTVSVE